MPVRSVLFSAALTLPLLLTSQPPASSQTVAGTAAAPRPADQPIRDYSKEGVVYEKLSTRYVYQADGTGERDISLVARIQSENAVHEAGLIILPYAGGNEHLEIEYVRVRKPDGTVISTPAADAQDQPAEVTRQAPFYSDLRQLQIPVKSLSPGDKLEYEVHEVLQKPLATNEFWGAANFNSGSVVLDETFELSVPKSKYALVLSPKLAPTITEEGDKKIYRWKSSQLEPTTGDEKKPPAPDADDLPSISWTTFRDWQEIGAWYSALARDRANVTPEIQAKAQELIKGKTTDDEKIQAIYDYVSTQVRYIGVAFGIGRYQPHSAEAVLDNQYGDCKDKHTLLAALLKAAGYDAWPALIGSSTKMHVELPMPSQFDHVITVVSLPGGPIWLDSTPEVTPYRMLMAPLRDKNALVIPTNGPAKLMRTPADGPFPFHDEFDGTGKLAADGTLKGHIVFTMRGDNEIAFREVFHSVPRAQWQAASQNMSRNMGFAGDISNVDVSLPEKTATPFTYAYDYERKEYGDWANHRIVPITMAVSVSEVSDDNLQKPLELGAPRQEIHHSTIELPPNYTATLPPTVKYTTPFAEYESTYKLDGDKFVNERRLTILKDEVPVEKLSEYNKFAKNVEADENQFTQLYAKGGSKIEETENNPEADQLIQAAFADISREDANAARIDLNNASQLSPHERGLWAGYAVVDGMEHRMDDSIADYRKELQNHPDNLRVYQALAATQMVMKRPDDAEATLRDGLKIFPDDKPTVLQLSSFLIRRKKYTDASNLLEGTLKTSPDDKNLAIQTARAEMLSDKKDAGVANLRAALKDATDPGILNDASYELADANVDLPLAETSSKKALDVLEKQTEQTSLGNLSVDDLRRVNLLTAAWDTMGWIYLREGNLPMAEKYIAPSWQATQHSEVGDHLGQIYEKEGRFQDAADTYALAIAADTLSPDPSGEDSMRTGLKKLTAQGYPAKPKAPGEELGKQRSIFLPRLAASATKPETSADFFILTSAGNTEDVRFIRGDEQLRSAADELKTKKLASAFPEGSQAKIVRRGILYCSDAIKGCQFTLLLPQSTNLN